MTPTRPHARVQCIPALAAIALCTSASVVTAQAPGTLGPGGREVAVPRPPSNYAPALPILDTHAAILEWFNGVRRVYDDSVAAHTVVRTPYDAEADFRARTAASAGPLNQAIAAFYSRPIEAYLVVLPDDYRTRRYNVEQQRLTALFRLPIGVVFTGSMAERPDERTWEGYFSFVVARDTARALDVVMTNNDMVSVFRVVVERCGSDADVNVCGVITRPILRIEEAELWVGSSLASRWSSGPTGSTAASASMSAAGAAEAPSDACGDRPMCYDAGPLLVEVSRLTVTPNGAFRDVEITARLRNVSSRRLVLGYVPGSTLVVDDAGLQYTPNWALFEEARCIGAASGRTPDTTFALDPGTNKEVVFSARARATQSASTYTVSVGLAEIETSSGRPRAGRRYDVRIANVAPPHGLRAIFHIRIGCT